MRHYSMRHYYMLNQNPRLAELISWIQTRGLDREIHLNRTRFWVPDGAVFTEFILRFSGDCGQIVDSMNLATGLDYE